LHLTIVTPIFPLSVSPTNLRTDCPATIDLEVHTGDKTAFITRQERTHVRDVVGVRQPAQRHVEQEFLHVLVRVRHTHELLEESRSREQWAQRIHADLLLAELGGESFACLYEEVPRSVISRCQNVGVNWSSGVRERRHRYEFSHSQQPLY
jgi:hypothetical protein